MPSLYTVDVSYRRKSHGRCRLSSPCLVPRRTSIEFSPVLDKVAGSELIVQLTGWVVVFRRPCESEAARFFGCIGGCHDHLTTMAFATERWVNVQVCKASELCLQKTRSSAGYDVSHTIEMHDLFLGPGRLMWVVVSDTKELVLICNTS